MERVQYTYPRVYPVDGDRVRASVSLLADATGAMSTAREAVVPSCVIDRQLRITMFNPAWAPLAQAAADRSRSLAELYLLDLLPHAYHSDMREACAEMLRGRASFATCDVLFNHDPHQPWRLVLTPWHSDVRTVMGVAITAHPLGANKAIRIDQPLSTERATDLEHRRKQLARGLASISVRLASELDEQAIVQFAAQALVGQLGLAFARLWLYDEPSNELVLRSSAGLQTDLGGAFARLRLGQQIVGAIGLQRKPVLTNAVANEPSAGDPAWMRAHGLRSFLGYPLVVQQRLLGVMAVWSRDVVDDELVMLLEPLAHQVALALDRARVHALEVRARNEAQALAQTASTRAAQLSAMLAAINDGVWACDQKGQIVSRNEAALAMFGFAPHTPSLSTIDQIADLFTDQCADRSDCFGLHAALAGQSVRRELVLHSCAPDWSPMTVVVTATPMRDRTRGIIGAVAVVHDLTQQRAMEQLKNDFVSVAAHELRTPITAIKGYAQLALMRLRKLSDVDPLRNTLHTIDAQAERLSHLISELLDVTRIQGGRLELDAKPFDLVALVGRAVALTEHRAPQHHFVLDAPATLLVYADDVRIAQVLENMLDNAVKYSPDGGAIEVTCAEVVGEAQVLVRDYGVGISDEKQPRVFEPWFQAHTDSIGDYGGLGLGLSICKEIIERHGGRMWFDSVADQGSRFGFALPLPDRTA